jgi:cell division protein FtsB
MGNFFNFNDLKTKLNSKRHIISFLLVFLAAGFILFSDYGIVKRISLEFQEKSFDKRISYELSRQDSLKRTVKKLTNDTLEIERIAREHYGMLKPGEKVYIIKKF